MYKTAKPSSEEIYGKHRGSSGTERGTLQELGRRHLWMHFTRMSAYDDHEIPIIVRGEGCYVYDEHGNRYLDGLSALFCVNIGHGRADIAQAGADQAKELASSPTGPTRTRAPSSWPRASPSSRPGDLNRVFFTSGGSEAVESALKLCRQYHKVTGNPHKTKFIARDIAYHGTSLGALSRHRHHQPARRRSSRSPRAACTCPTPTPSACPTATRAELADAVAEKIEFEGPETVAAVIMEPVQNAGGCFVPPEGYWQRVREICDEYNVLLISDEVICAWGRLGEWFGAQRFDYEPDIITTAKGLTSAYAPMGAVIASDRVAEPFMEGHHSFTHGFTFAGHPVCAAIALANLDVMESEGIIENVRNNEGPFREMLDSLRDIPIVGDVRGTGYFHAIELVKDQDSDAQWTDEESETLLRGYLSGELYRARAHLPRRRPRRPGHPALAAAHRRARASSTRSSPSCGRC